MKVIKINQIKSIEELKKIQIKYVALPELFDNNNILYMDFINKSNELNIAETNKLNKEK